MRKFISIVLTLSLVLFCASCAGAEDNAAPAPAGNEAVSEAPIADADVLTLQIGNPMMTVNGTQQEIDPGAGTAPIAQNGRTFLPIRAIIEALGGTVDWDQDTQTVTITMPKAAQTQPAATGKTLVVYYSATNTTEGVAEKIAAYTGADIFEITPSEPYTDDDLDWTDNNSRVVAEHDDPDGRHVELETTDVPDWDSYDTVYIGAPIWWGEFSWVIDDFVKNNDFTGKTVVPFCTSMSSGLGDSGKHVGEMASSGNWLDGKRFGTRASEAEVQEWIDSLELN